MKPRILVVAHDVALRAALAQWLGPAGYALELSEGPRRARQLIADARFALAIVAPDRLGAGGLDLARALGDAADGLIVVAERPDDIARLAESMPGADCCLSKPLDKQEVLARVATALRLWLSGDEAASEILRFGGFRLAVAGRSLRGSDGKEIALTRSEFAMLLALAHRPGRVLSRDRLRHAVAGRGAEAYERSVDVLIARLRRKIEASPKEPRLIVTVPGEGYKLAAWPIVLAGPPDAPSSAADAF